MSVSKINLIHEQNLVDKQIEDFEKELDSIRSAPVDSIVEPNAENK